LDLEDLIKKSIIKIESIFKEQSTNKITIQRKYLQEIFSTELVEISENDGLPTLKSFVIGYFKIEGIIINIFGNEVQFNCEPGLIKLKEEMVKALENTLELKDEQIDTLEKAIKTTLSLIETFHIEYHYPFIFY